MKIIICGAGEVGSHSMEVLSGGGATIIVIDRDHQRLAMIEDTMDVRTMLGNAADAQTLKEAGASATDLVIAATNFDEINLLAASIAKGLGAKKSIARVHDRAYFEKDHLDYEDFFTIDRLICPEYSTALAIARTLRNPVALAIEHFGRGNIDMQQFPVSPDAKAVGVPLAELSLPRGSRLAAIIRKREVFIPRASTTVEKGDTVVLVANADVFADARRLFYEHESGRKNVVIMGGTPMAAWLATALRGGNWSIRLFETDRERAEELAITLSWVTVLCADPTNKDVFDEERLAQADVFIALTEDEEVNIIGCVLAKSRGVAQVIAVVQRPNYLDLLYHIGVDKPFSPRMVAVKEIERVLDDSPVRRLATLAEGGIGVYQIRTGPNAEVADMPLRDLQPSKEWVIAALAKDDQIHVPGADDTIHPGDTVLVVTTHKMEKMLTKLFDAK